MRHRNDIQVGWRHFLPVLALALVLILFGGAVFASDSGEARASQSYERPANDFAIGQHLSVGGIQIPIDTNTPCPTGTPGLEDVMIMDFSFQPQVLDIQTGTFVRWTNHDAVGHTATSDTGIWDSGTLGRDQQYQFMFLTPGTFTYHCAVHLSMTGTINVTQRPGCGTPSITITPTHEPYVGNAFLVMVPDTSTVGSCPAPSSGGVTQVGCRFVLDLMLNTGSREDAIAQQSYLTFTWQTVQNARVSSIGTSCVPTSTVTSDETTFDAPLQNEICNGPSPCVFRGVTVGPGSFAYASGAIGNCPKGCGGIFRVAQVGICAIAPGLARLHWQFSPPAPLIRDTEIIALNGDEMQDRTLFTDYAFLVNDGLTPDPTLTPPPTFMNTNTATRTNTPSGGTTTPTPDAFLEMVPDTNTLGNCPAPPNGGTTQYGCRFVLDFMVNTGSREDATAQQSYLTFSYNQIENARVSSIGTSCVPTNTVTGDLTTFDATLQNEVCNGPGQCVFRGVTVDPGSFAYASGALNNCPKGCGGVFRVAEVGICAVGYGTATMHWQFSPPDPMIRDTEIVAFDGDLIHNRNLFTDYTFYIPPPFDPTRTNSPTYTPGTPTHAATYTFTRTYTATPTNTPTRTFTRTPTYTNTPLSGTTTPTPDGAFLEFVPDGAGNCPAPPNGGTTTQGCRFGLDLMLNTGSRNDATAQQSYITFTYNLIQLARVSDITTTCTITSTVTGDLTTFDAVLQNEVCNGPAPCVFRGVQVGPGSFAFASGALSNCPEGCGGYYRVAQTAWCAIAPGRAVLHWQFSPPAPMIRDTEIVAFNGDLIHNRALFRDYVFDIFPLEVTPSSTPTRTITPSYTPTRSNTPVSTATFTNTPVRTPTNTPVRTNTPGLTQTPCGQCNLDILVVTSSCNIDGTVHWISVVHNPDPCAVAAPWRAELQIRTNGGSFRAVRIQYATSVFPPGDTILDGVFCYHFSSNVTDVRVEYLFEEQDGRSRSEGSNAVIQEKAAPPNSYSTTPDSGIPAARSRSNPASPMVCDGDMASHPMPPCAQTGTCGIPPTPMPTGVPTHAPALPPGR